MGIFGNFYRLVILFGVLHMILFIIELCRYRQYRKSKSKYYYDLMDISEFILFIDMLVVALSLFIWAIWPLLNH